MAFSSTFAEQKPFNDAWGLLPGGGTSEQPRTWNPGSGRFEPRKQGSPIQTMEIRYDRDKLGGFSDAINKALKWKEISAASQDYSQSGTDIPSYSEGFGGAFAAGSDFPGQGFGYQYQSPSAVAQGIPVGQDPIFRRGPLTQEDFSEMVNYNLDLKKYGPTFKAPATAPAGPKLPFFKPV